jgi:protein TonB
MAYADQPTMSTRKVVSIGLVVLLHALIGYAFITGLAYNVIKKAAEDLKVVDVTEEPPPPEQEPPPPPPEQKFEPPPIVAPPPIVQTPTLAPPPIATVTTPPPPQITPAAPVAPAPPPAPVVSQAAQARGNPGQYFGADSYPPAALRAEAQGRVVAQLTIGTDGRVTDCVVTSSSGNNDLDETTCRIALRRIRYTPAKDQAGNPISTKTSLPVRWQLPQD